MKMSFFRSSIIITIFAVLGLPAICLAGPPQVYPTRSFYNAYEPITIAYKNLTGSGSDWITIVPVGTPPDVYGDWQYVPSGILEGSAEFNGLAEGSYEVRVYLNWRRANGYRIAARSRFQVGAYNAPPPPPEVSAEPPAPQAFQSPSSSAEGIRLSANKQDYQAYEPITVYYAGLPGTRGDWLTIVPEQTPSNQYGEWVYTNGHRSGSVTFSGMQPGRYEARVYINWPSGGYNVAARLTFLVH